MHKKLILASSSKSRFQILKNAGLRFLQETPNCNENEIKKKIDNKNPTTFVKKLSYEKSKSISCLKKNLNKTVIGCDTVVYFNKTIFDKAKTINDAHKKLQLMSGKEHKIISGITLTQEGKKIWQCHDTTTVKIRNLSSKQISDYLNNTGKQILDSVGCYQIESKGPLIIESIKGDFFNVMGLPLFKLLHYIYSNK